MMKISKLAGILLLGSALAFGQASMTSTTLSAAITSSQLTFVVASATGINGPGFPQSQGGIGSSTTPAAITVLYVDREAMRVASVNSTTVTVERGYEGTATRSHKSGAKLWVGPAGYFASIDPSGACTAASLLVLPRVVIPNGNLWTCGNGFWTTFAPYNSELTVGAAIASATTIAPTNPVFHVTGTTDVVTITVPPACPATGCQIIIVPDGIFHTTNAGNVAIASTAVVSKALIMTYDPGSSKWYPSY